MKIYTSYFSNPELKKFDGLKISIARYDNRFKTIIDDKIIDIAPSRDLLKLYKDKKIDFDEYAYLYLGEVCNYGEANRFNEIYNILHKYNKDIVLLCYEKDDKECHRSIFREWYNSFSKNKIEEL